MDDFKSLNRVLSLIVMTGLLSLASLANASVDEMLEDLDLDTLLLDEIVVTAQKKKQSLTEAPVSVTLLDGSRINALSTFTAEELSKLTAGLSLFNDGGVNTGAAIRGVGAESSQLAPSRVGTYLDGLEVASRTAFAFANIYDVESVQILRGPQGSLYGQPSPSGAILIKTAEPDLLQQDGYLQASSTDPAGYNIQGGLSLPLIEDVLAVRLAAVTESRETGVENIETGGKETIRRNNFRFKTLFQPRFDLKLGLTYSRTSFDDSNYMSVLETTDLASAAANATPSAANVYDLKPSDRTSISESDTGFENADTDFYGFYADWEHENFTLHWQTTTYDQQEQSLVDTDNTNLVLAINRVSGTAKSLQHELRVVSNPASWWEMQSGAYYVDGEAATKVRSLAFTATGGVADTKLNLPLGTQVKALFTHNEFALTDDLSLIFGLRYNEWDATSNSTYFSEVYGAGTALIAPNGVLTTFAPAAAVTPDLPFTPIKQLNEEEVTGTLKLVFDLGAERTVYATYDRGFRPGSFNFDPTGAFAGTEFNTYAGESVDTFELGLKGVALDNRAQYTLASYFARYDDFQTSPDFRIFNNATGTVGRSFLHSVNVDEAEQWGVEAEGRLLLNSKLSIFGSVNYSEIEFSKGLIPCTVQGATLGATNVNEFCDASGHGSTSQPKLTAVVQLDYVKPTSIGEWYATTLLNHRGSASTPGDSSGVLDTSSYSIVDAFAGFRTAEWGAKLWMKNILDDEAVRRRNTTLNPNSGYVWVRQEAGRSAGVTVDFWF